MAEEFHGVAAPLRPVPEGLHRRVTMRVYIASHQDRLARQLRHAAAIFALSVVLVAAVAVFAVSRTDMNDVDRYIPPGFLGHLDYYLASLRMAWSAYQGNHMLLMSALPATCAAILILAWWWDKRGEPSVRSGGRVHRD